MSNELLHPPGDFSLPRNQSPARREGEAGGSVSVGGQRLVSDPFNPSRPPHDPTQLPPGAAPAPPRTDLPPHLPEEMVVDPTSVLGPPRGGKKGKKAVLWEVLRPLQVPEDLPLLSHSLPQPKQTLLQIRHSHHQLAQMLSQGTKQEECSRITGYSPTYISILKTDPTFQELIAHYAGTRELLFVDVIERMRSLGLSTLDELQRRMEEDPDNFSNRELFEQAELMLVKPMAATRGLVRPGEAGSTGGGGIQVNVNFIKSDSPSLRSGELQNPSVTIDMDPDPSND